MSCGAAGLATEPKVLEAIKGIIESRPELPSLEVLVIAPFIIVEMEGNTLICFEIEY